MYLTNTCFNANIYMRWIMLKRKIEQNLIDWKNNKNKECLLVKGARQVGKTFIIREFGKSNYTHFLEINFEQKPEFKEVFNGSLDTDEIIKQLSLLIPSARFVPNETLLFLDEIQACPKARTSLKFFAEDNRFDVIASGSLLGINYKDVSSYPVGYERQIQLHSLDFEEFLWATGVTDKSIADIKEYFLSLEYIPHVINDKMLSLVREYITIGGMPSVVNKYLETKNFSEVHAEQEKITTSYLDDIAKYAPTSDKPKARNCYLSIPNQLLKENKKFKYSAVEKGGTSRKYTNSLDWLRDANLATFCFNVSTPTFPLGAYKKDNEFKIYLNDIGLLVSMYGFEMKAAIIKNTLTGSAKGGIYENLIADMLIKKNIPLVYYKSENSTLEIEFLINSEINIIPVEVKAGNSATASLNSYLQKFKPEYAYKFITGNAGENENKRTLPLYMAMFL